MILRFLPSFVFLFAFAVCPFLCGQIEIYDFGNPASPAVQGNKNYITAQARYNGKHLVLETAIEKDWHLYSVTQPDGGTIRTTFRFESPELQVEEIRPLSEPHVQSNVAGFGVDIEEHDDSITWIFTFKDDLLPDKNIRCTLSGQVCQAGEGGTCIPFDHPFEAIFDKSLDAVPLLEKAKNIRDRFIVRGTPQKQTSITSDHPMQPQEITEVTTFQTALLYAFLGGIILNFMPCVLPVIGLKILSFFEQAGKSRLRAFTLNVWYSLGLLSVFLVLAWASYGLSILFTFDIFNILMACFVFTMALSLMGVWELTVPSFLGRGVAVQLAGQEGAFGAFFKGIITTLLAIPCGAPLLSPAVNWADMQNRSGNSMLVFIAYGMIGLGMASPYLIIGAFPELLRFLPKPGAWMETFKKTMGFFLLIAVVWILYFVQLERVLPTIALLFALWFACWKIGGYEPKTRFSFILSLTVIAAVFFFSFNITKNPYTLENAMKTRIYGNEGNHWKLYSQKKFEEAMSSGKPIIIDFTADWCVNCKVLEQTVLHSNAVLKKLDEKKVISLVGDCTKEGEAKVFLRKFGADQVPVLVVFDPNKPQQPLVLRGGYTQKTLLGILEML